MCTLIDLDSPMDTRDHVCHILRFLAATTSAVEEGLSDDAACGLLEILHLCADALETITINN